MVPLAQAYAPGRSRTAWKEALPFIVSGLLTLAVVVYFVRWGHRDGLDLQVYRAGIRNWRSSGNPYASGFTIHHLPFTYPPFALLALSPFSFLPLPASLTLLWLLSIGALAVTVYLVSLRGGQRGGARLVARSVGWTSFAVLAVEPVRSTLDYGQINALLLCSVVVDLLVIPRRHRGWLIGLAAAVKLTPLVFLALPLLERDRKSLCRGVVAAAGASGLMWLLWPATARTYWVKDFSSVRRVGNVASVGNQSLYGLLHRWPFSGAGEPGVWVLLAAITIGLGLSIARQCLASERRALAILAIALVGLLVSPISWTHHWVWVVLIPPLLLSPEGRTLGRSV
ncbi:MAG TPA: glycosyltransferase 87 family protein, partial [Acidimicrobiales bacterium]|nr:glycosyltransferase 87 family protein [Acidimicrobiales bacterium]